ncbi:MAG: hypothetical protein KDD39_04505 [Bdellovibrionales bacterium]|nr:hypothetical protein [Bdellovibrionales bacterium]
MTNFSLIPFESEPNFQVAGTARIQGHALQLVFEVRGSNLVLPARAERPSYQEGLWRTTCFELFVADPTGTSYEEFNFAPSGDWWHARFQDYRVRAENSARPSAPLIRTSTRPVVRVEVELPNFSAGQRVCAPCAVLEHSSGAISYWAMKHSGDRADFHRREAFSLHL